jgi:hypothetical protein
MPNEKPAAAGEGVFLVAGDEPNENEKCASSEGAADCAGAGAKEKPSPADGAVASDSVMRSDAHWLVQPLFAVSDFAFNPPEEDAVKLNEVAGEEDD